MHARVAEGRASSSLAPLTTPGWPVKDGSLATKPTTLTTRVDLVEVAHDRLHGRDGVERAGLRELLGVLGGHQPVAVADLAGGGQRAGDEGQLAGGVDVVAVAHRRDVGRDRRRDVGDAQPELGQPVLDARLMTSARFR